MSHADRTISSRLPADPRPRAGRLGRLGRWSARRLRLVAAIWAAVFVALVALAPQTEHALSGGGWKADGSESSRARTLIDRHFEGAGAYGLSVAVHSSTHTADAPGFRATLRRVRGVLEREPAVRFARASANPVSVSADRRTAVVRAGAAADDDAEMVRAAGRLRARLEGVGSPGVDVLLTGSPAIWSEFNAANKAAMLRSEVMSWPLTLAVLVLAFGSLAAAGLPLLLSLLGLVATAGMLWIGAQATDISIWAMNFALMFALAVGIDYALLIVVRFRAALRSGLTPPDAIEVTMDTAGRAVLLSGVAVLASLLAMMVVPSQPFRTSALGILLAVTFVLAASLTLLPAILAHLGVRVDRLALPWSGAIQHRSEAFARWARRIWARPIRLGVIALAVLVALALPATQLRTAMPSVGVLPEDATARAGYARLQDAFGPGAPAELQVVAPAAVAQTAEPLLQRHPGVAAVLPAEERDGLRLIRVVPAVDGSRVRSLIDELRSVLPAGALVGGQSAEGHDLERALARSTPLVYALVLGVGFLLLVLTLRAPVAAAAAVALNVIATAAAFGIAKLILQDGHGAALLGIDPQGFINAWAPVFFFALIFALAMDYSVFLLAAVKEHHDRTGDPRTALIEGLASSGRVINAAGAVMVCVFFTFALTGPLPPREMGLILGTAVLLDTVLVRLVLLPVVLRLLGSAAWWRPPLSRLVSPRRRTSAVGRSA